MKAALKELEKEIKTLVLTAENIGKNDVPTLCKFYKELHSEFEELEALYEIVKALKQKLSYETIPETFENHGFDSVKLAGRNFVVGVRLNASIPLDMRENGFKWLREVKLDNIIIPQVNPKTLSSAVKQYIEEVGREPPSDAIKLHKQKFTSMRKV